MSSTLVMRSSPSTTSPAEIVEIPAGAGGVKAEAGLTIAARDCRWTSRLNRFSGELTIGITLRFMLNPMKPKPGNQRCPTILVLGIVVVHSRYQMVSGIWNTVFSKSIQDRQISPTDSGI